MVSFIEFEDDKKTLKSINLDDFSVEDLEDYIKTLTEEIDKARKEITKRLKTKEEAQKFFK